MAKNSKYSILVEALIKEQSIQTQLNNLSKKYVLNIKAKIDMSDIENQIKLFSSKLADLQQKVAPQAAGKVRIIDTQEDQKSLDALYARIEKIKKATGASAVKYDMFTVMQKNGEKLTKAVLTYNDGLGNAKRETLAWVNTTKQVEGELVKIAEWTNVANQYTDDGIKKERDKQRELEKTAALIDKMNQKAENALAKTQGRKVTPEVQRVIDSANALKEAAAAGDVAKMKQFSNEVTNTVTAMGNLGKNTLSWNQAMKTALERIAQWGIATTIIYGSIRQFREATEYVKELDESLTNIQIVTGATAGEIQYLTRQFNGLANELGATTLEIAEGSLEWFRQGKTIQETSELMRSATILAKLGNLDAAESTELLTSTINGFKLEAEDVVSVVDKLIAVDNAYATSAGEIAKALQYSANSAQQAGISFDELVSYIATVSDVTRRGAESIGQSFKTMFARMQTIKLGKVFEDDATTINDVEKALSLVNIQLRETDDTFRPLSDVIAETASKWEQMTTVEQGAVAGAIAGARQRENFIVLMENFNKVLEAQRIEMNSSGLATERFGTYLDSVEAHANKFSVAWERMWQETINKDSIKDLYDLGAGFLNLIADIGGLIGALEHLITVLNPVYYLIFKLNEVLRESRGTTGINLLDEFSELRNETESSVSELTNLASEYEELANKTYKTEEETRRLLDIQSILNTKYDASENGINAYSDAIGKNSLEIQNNIKWLKEKAKQEAEDFVKNQRYAYESAKRLLEEQKTRTGGGFRYGTGIDSQKRTLEEYRELLIKNIETNQGNVEVQKNILDGINKEIAAAQQLIIEYEHYKNLLADIDSSWDRAILNQRNVPTIVRDQEQDVFDLKSALEELQTFVDGPLGNAYDNFVEKQEDLYQEVSNLRSKIEEASSFPQSAERDAELDSLNQALQDTNRAIDDNAAAYEDATRRILFSMMLQRIGQMEVAGQMDSATASMAYNMVYNLGMSWGIVDQMTVDAVNGMSRALQYLRDGEIPAAAQAIYNLGEAAKSIAGDYYIRYHISYEQDLKGGEQEGAGFVSQEVGMPAAQVPKGGWYPKGFGGGGGSAGGGGSKSKAQEEKISMQSLFNMIISLIKQEKREEIDLLRARQDELEKEQDLLKEQEKLLDDQLDAYKEIIDTRKELLRSEEDEITYQEDIEERNRAIAKLQQELAIISLDDSLEAQSKRLEIEEELAEQLDDLRKTQREHSYDEQEKALDKEYELYKEKIEAEKSILEERRKILEDQKDLLDEQIDIIQEFLSKSGLIAQEALERMAEKAPDLYQQLIDWNSEYGSGIKEDVVDAWEEAYKALEKYGDLVRALKGGEGGSSASGGGSGNSKLNWKRRYGIPEGSSDWEEAVKLGKKKFLEKHPEYKEKHHTGLESGPVGGFKTNVNEVFTRLFKGETVLDERDMINIMNKIPEISSAMKNNSPMGNIVVEKLINIEGNVDKSVIPDIKKITKQVVEELNSTLIKRGYNRGVQMYTS